MSVELKAYFSLGTSITMPTGGPTINCGFNIGTVLSGSSVKSCNISNVFFITGGIDTVSPSPIFSGGCAFALSSRVESYLISGNEISSDFALSGDINVYSENQSIYINGAFTLGTEIVAGSDIFDCQLAVHNSNRWT